MAGSSEKKTNAIVSLVTPGWNGKAFVHRLLDSIIAQTYRPIQYIYVDDGSTDGTAEIVKGYEEKFKEAGIDFFFIHQENAGMCQALMNGFQYVKGAYLSNPEYDDILFPKSVERRVDYLESHPDCAVVVADAWIVFENHLEERKRLISHKNPNRFDRNHFYQCLMTNTIFNAACYMVRMDKFDETHPNRKIYDYKYGSNQQILLPLYYHWNRGFIEMPLSLYLLRESSLSNHEILSFDGQMEKLKEYQETIERTLEGINMPKSDCINYKRHLHTYFQKEINHLAYKYKNKDAFEQSYSYLQSVGEITKTEREYDYYMRHRIARFWSEKKPMIFYWLHKLFIVHTL